jgi:ATP-dependent protease ClpP protease subunit
VKRQWYSMEKTGAEAAEVSIHDEIGMWGIRAKDFIRELRGLGDVKTIGLSVHSPGGDVMDGLAIYNALAEHPARIVARVEGMAASMGSVILMAADEVQMPANAFLMIHNPWSFAVGDADAMRKEADLLDKVKASLVRAYARRGLDPVQIEAWMSEETWFDGVEAQAAGLVDVVLDVVRAAACASRWMDRFDHAPDELVEDAISEFIEQHERREQRLTQRGGQMSAKKKWWEIMAGASKDQVAELNAEIVRHKARVAELEETVEEQGEKIEQLQEEIDKKDAEIEEVKEAAEKDVADKEASVEARAAAKALEIAAAQGVPAALLPVAELGDDEDPTTPEAIRAKWAAMADGPEKRAYFKAHRVVLMS